MEPKKRSMAAGERDEFLRAAWRLLFAQAVGFERLVFLRTRWEPTSRFAPSTPGRVAESGRMREGAALASLGQERHPACEHHPPGLGSLPSG
jgi:hypothetical protein